MDRTTNTSFSSCHKWRGSRLLEHFLQAVGNEDLERLAALLADEVTFWADGERVRGAALEPVHGRLAVAHFVLSSVLAPYAPVAARYLVAAVNGKPTLLIYSADGTPAIVVSVEVGEARIQTIWAIANPDKLSRL